MLFCTVLLVLGGAVVGFGPGVGSGTELGEQDEGAIDGFGSGSVVFLAHNALTLKRKTISKVDPTRMNFMFQIEQLE